MAGNQGTATLSFAADPQPAQYITSTVVTDSAPNPNLITWSPQILPATTTWGAIAYGNGVFVALSATTSTIAATSPDGVTWTQQTLPANTAWRNIVFGNGTFVAIASGTIAATSPNGVTWTQQTLPANTTWAALAFGGGIFVAVANNSAIAATSSDGVTWTQQTLVPGVAATSLTYGNGLFLATSQNTAIALTSPNGVTWTQQTLPTADTWSWCTYGNGLFIVTGLGRAFINTSPDGVNWTQRTGYANSFGAITYGNGQFVSLPSLTSTNIALVSTNGITWLIKTLPITATWNALSFGNGLYFATLTGNLLAASPDGVSGIPLPNTRTITTVNTLLKPAAPVVGSNIASVTVTGQTGLLTTSTVDAWLQANDSTADFNGYEHGIAPIKLTTGEIIAGTGFTITGMSECRLNGDFTVHWIWRD